jgi:hypothetical protein
MQTATHTYMYPKVTPIAAGQGAATPKPAAAVSATTTSPRPGQ